MYCVLERFISNLKSKDTYKSRHTKNVFLLFCFRPLALIISSKYETTNMYSGIQRK